MLNVNIENPFEPRLCAMLNQFNAVLCDWDFLQNKIYCSAEFTKIIGIPMIQAISPLEYLERAPVVAEDISDFKAWISRFRGGNAEGEIVLRIYHSGGVRWITLATTPVYSGGAVARIIITMRDITSECEEREILCRDVLTDPLTGLYNKQSAMKSIEDFLSSPQNTQTHAFFLLDLDDFKSINDNYGHFEGDKVIARAGIALRSVFRTTDIVGRIGGDEFIALMRSCTIYDAQRKACEICAAFSGNALPNISVGATICTCGCTFEQVFISADRAMYKSKASGKNTYTIV